MSPVSKIYSATYKLFKDHPRLLQPFLLLFLLQILLLVVLYFSPRLPLRNVFGPIIRTFWGQRAGATFLHYPYSFILLPKLFQISSLALSVFVGALTSGIAITMIAGIENKRRLDFFSAARLTIGKYMYLFIIVVLWVVTLHYSAKFFNKGVTYLAGILIKSLLMRPKAVYIISNILFWFLIVFNFLLTVVIHSLLVYAIPVLIFEKEKLWKSILKSLAFFKERWVTTLIFVGLPMLAYVPFSILLQKPSFLISKFFPEFVAYVILLGVIVNYLLIDPLITVSAALFYLSHRKEK
jgi:hypothetical protein